MDGLLRVDKPAGPTSHDVVDRVRRLLGTRKIGHVGTLDPPATGLLVLLLGAATRLQQYAMGTDKSYRYELVLGRATDTLDMSGAAVAEERVGLPSPQALHDACRGLEGCVALVPPMVSALHYQGKRLYELARSGQVVDLDPKECRISRLEPTGPAWMDESGLVRIPMAIECSSGTYVRSVGRALGAALGAPACIDHLQRTRVGPWKLEGALDLRGSGAVDREQVVQHVEPMEEVVSLFPRWLLSEAEERAFIHGNPVTVSGGKDGFVAVHGPSGFLGVGVVELGQRLTPKTVIGRREAQHG